MTDFKERNLKILDDRCRGRTLQSIADQHHIGKERVRSIIEHLVRRIRSFDTIRSRLEGEITALKSEVKRLQLDNSDGKSLELFEFSARTSNALNCAGIDTIEQLKALNKKDLYAIPNMGRKSVTEVLDAIRCHYE